MKMNSVQRRIERYKIMYTWKVIEGRVPDCGIKVSQWMGKNGRKCEIPPLVKGAKEKMKTMRDSTFQVSGPKLFNAMSKNIRDLTKCGIVDFKEKLDMFLTRIPDEPAVSGLIPGACKPDSKPSNSLIHQVSHMRGLDTGQQ